MYLYFAFLCKHNIYCVLAAKGWIETITEIQTYTRVLWGTYTDM